MKTDPDRGSAGKSPDASRAKKHRPAEPASESADLEPIPLDRPGAEEADAAGAPAETEELFVILPEEETDAAHLPVVETVVVEDSSWESGPTTTEVLKQGSGDLSAGTTSETALTDVQLVKTNPLGPGAEESGEPGADTDTEEASAVEAAGMARPDEEIKVIDEIADIAADLDHQDSLDDEATDQLTAASMGPSAPASSGRGRLFFITGTLAALVVGGFFFRSDIEGLYNRILGDGEDPAVAKAHAVGKNGGKGGPGGGAAQPSDGAAGAHDAARSELKARIQLAMRVGLERAGGKE